MHNYAAWKRTLAHCFPYSSTSARPVDPSRWLSSYTPPAQRIANPAPSCLSRMTARMPDCYRVAASKLIYASTPERLLKPECRTP